jgi:hypothetical protein
VQKSRQQQAFQRVSASNNGGWEQAHITNVGVQFWNIKVVQKYLQRLRAKAGFWNVATTLVTEVPHAYHEAQCNRRFIRQSLNLAGELRQQNEGCGVNLPPSVVLHGVLRLLRNMHGFAPGSTHTAQTINHTRTHAGLTRNVAGPSDAVSRQEAAEARAIARVEVWSPVAFRVAHGHRRVDG